MTADHTCSKWFCINIWT